ncbi:MAG: HU family DNA-binding protein [Rhodobacteraceae bacterium]|nr:HU family DNA-binding protein [Paracoccaceae bacterium]
MAQTALTKAELTASVAQESGTTLKDTNAVLNALTSVITETVGNGGAVSLPGVGKISSRARAARKVRNPQTGAVIEKAADNAPRMTFAKALKEACNS